MVESYFCQILANLSAKFTGKSEGIGKCEGKSVPIQAWAGPEVFRMLRFPDFKTVGT
jgi:hypothetical protein